MRPLGCLSLIALPTGTGVTCLMFATVVPVETLVCISLVSTKLTSGPLFLLCRGEQDGHAAA